MACVWRRPACFALVQPESAAAIVAVCQFRARFRSRNDPPDLPPAVGLSRTGMLLLNQETIARSDADAIAACRRHHAFDAVILQFGVRDPVLLHKPRNKAFLPLHEQALRDGSALSYDPDSAPDSEAPVVTSWGFSRKDGR